MEGASRDYQPTPVINANGASTSIDVQTTARLRNDRGELRAAPVASAGIVGGSYSMPARKPAPVASAGIINGSYSMPNGAPQTPVSACSLGPTSQTPDPVREHAEARRSGDERLHAVTSTAVVVRQPLGLDQRPSAFGRGRELATGREPATEDCFAVVGVVHVFLVRELSVAGVLEDGDAPEAVDLVAARRIGQDLPGVIRDAVCLRSRPTPPGTSSSVPGPSAR